MKSIISVYYGVCMHLFMCCCRYGDAFLSLKEELAFKTDLERLIKQWEPIKVNLFDFHLVHEYHPYMQLPNVETENTAILKTFSFIDCFGSRTSPPTVSKKNLQGSDTGMVTPTNNKTATNNETISSAKIDKQLQKDNSDCVDAFECNLTPLTPLNGDRTSRNPMNTNESVVSSINVDLLTPLTPQIEADGLDNKAVKCIMDESPISSLGCAYISNSDKDTEVVHEPSKVIDLSNTSYNSGVSSDISVDIIEDFDSMCINTSMNSNMDLVSNKNGSYADVVGSSVDEETVRDREGSDTPLLNNNKRGRSTEHNFLTETDHVVKKNHEDSGEPVYAMLETESIENSDSENEDNDQVALTPMEIGTMSDNTNNDPVATGDSTLFYTVAIVGSIAAAAAAYFFIVRKKQ